MKKAMKNVKTQKPIWFKKVEKLDHEVVLQERNSRLPARKGQLHIQAKTNRLSMTGSVNLKKS
jgi:hypothetical protein